jgi:hypothetical protein
VSSVSGAHKDSRIEGLGGLARDGVRLLGVDSVTDDSNDVVDSDSGGPMGEGPGRDDTTDLGGLAGGGLAGETGSSDATREGLDTDSGSSMFRAIVIVDTDGGVLSMSEGELVEGEITG